MHFFSKNKSLYETLLVLLNSVLHTFQIPFSFAVYKTRVCFYSERKFRKWKLFLCNKAFPFVTCHCCQSTFEFWNLQYMNLWSSFIIYKNWITLNCNIRVKLLFRPTRLENLQLVFFFCHRNIPICAKQKRKVKHTIWRVKYGGMFSQSLSQLLFELLMKM